MKKLFTFLALTISFSVNSQISTSGTNNSGIFSSAIGFQTSATGDYSTAIGYSSTASESYCTAIGYSTNASGSTSTAMGVNTTASGDGSTTMGNITTASGNNSTAMGNDTTASGSTSTAMGFAAIASGSRSTAMGIHTKASDYGSLVIGHYNLSGSSITNSATAFNVANTAFVIGNGTSGNLSDAFKVMFNGDVTVSNNLTVVGDVEVQSDERLKSNIVSLGSTLSKLILIDGKSYEKDGKQRIGVLAQEIQKVFPELVTVDGNEMLAVNYQGLVPVLINALKEQDKIIKSQEARLTNIENLISNLND